ncbi:hypothetical protein XENOCAPTIV_002248, partial [Xenoophorus captivus]
LMMGDFFGTGMIVADFRQRGMTACGREKLQILVKMRVRRCAQAEDLTRYSVWAQQPFWGPLTGAPALRCGCLQ